MLEIAERTLGAGRFSLEKFVETFPALVEAAGGTKHLRELALRHGLTKGFDQETKVPWSSGTVDDFASFLNGYAFKSEWFKQDGVRLLRNVNVSHGVLDWTDQVCLPDGRTKEFERFSLADGDIVISLDRPIISTGVKVARVSPRDLPCLLLQRVARASGKDHLVHPDFLLLWFSSTLFTETIDPGRSNGVPHISTKQIGQIPMLLPPLADQKRIVARVDQLMALIDQLEAKQNRKRDLGARFTKASLEALTTAESPQALTTAWTRIESNWPTLLDHPDKVAGVRQTVLELAFSGRLAQDSTGDTPVARTVESLRAGWAKLARTEFLPDVADEERPASPTRWRWIRLGNLAEVIGGVTKGRDLKGRKLVGIPYLRVANVQQGFLDLAAMKDIEIPADELPKYQLQVGDVLFTEGGDWDKLGRSAIWNGDIKTCIHQNHVFRARLVSSHLDPAWVSAFANSPLGRRYFESAAKRTTNLASINMTQLRNCPIPVPPVEEKKRIVAKVECLMKLCDTLEAALRRREDRAAKLAEAVVQEMVA